MRRLFPSILVIAASIALPQTGPSKTRLVGVWQNQPYQAAGWNDTYCFFADGRVDFHYNQMDLDKRLLVRSGTWKLSNATLTLTFSRETLIVGGRRAKPGETFEGESTIVGGKTVERKLRQPIVFKLNISPAKARDGHTNLSFGGKHYFKFSDDPKSYD